MRENPTIKQQATVKPIASSLGKKTIKKYKINQGKLKKP